MPAETFGALGTYVYVATRDAAELPAARRITEDVLAEVDRTCSRFRDDSELTALNRRAGSGASVPVSRRLRVLLATAERARRMTDGRFDARVVAALERLGEPGADPTSDGASSRVAPVTGGGVTVRVPDVPIDSGGIGKGLALRWAAARAIALLPAGGGLLLDGGGDLVAEGSPPEGGWSIGVEDPVASDPALTDPVAVLRLERGAVATSSVAVRRWISPDGRPVHHLLDPRTGEPARTGLLAVTVAARDPAWAEVWTKALFVAGRAGIAREARARGLAAWWIDDRGALGMTPAARVRTAWAAEARQN